jgi:hypothetical protein
MYTFMKVFFKTNLFICLSHFQTQHLKIIHDLYSQQIFDLILVRNGLF